MNGILSGHSTCTGLSDRGREQAEALRERLVDSGELGRVDAVYTSILPRAIETAEIISPAFGGVEPIAECDWCEIHAGEGEGLSYEEFRAKYIVDGEPDDPYRRRMPGSETWAEFYIRAGSRLRRVAAEHPGERVVVVCHGGIVGASFVALGDLPIDKGVSPTRMTVNTSLTEWQWSDSSWHLARYNDWSHLTR